MASRRNIPPSYDDRFIQPSEMARRGPLLAQHHSVEPPPLPVLLENKLASQAAEIERLGGDNHKLATSHLAMRQDYVAAQQEIEKLREHIRSTQNEGDIQIRILLDKIAKREADIRGGNQIKKELEEAFLEARSLATDKLELTNKIQQASQELEKARADLKKLPEMHSELDTLRQEHQRLRKTFEYEKGLNVQKVEQMKILEKDLVAIAGEVERLRTEISNAEKRANAPTPYSGPYMNSDSLYPPQLLGNGGYVDAFGRPLQMVNVPGPGGMNPYASGGYAVGPGAVVGAGAGVGYAVGTGPAVNAGGGYAVGPGPVVSAGAGGGYAVGAGPVAGGGYAVGAHPVGSAGVGGARNPSAWGGVYDASNTQK